MSEKIKGTGRHLTMDDRVMIETGLNQDDSLRTIAKATGKTTSAISREIQRNRIQQPRNTFNDSKNQCVHRLKCKKRNVCDPETKRCRRKCASCGRCNSVSKCADFEPDSYHCDKTDLAPFVCNGCRKKSGCRLEKFYYRASSAQRSYETLLRDSRQGLNITKAELAELDAVVSPLIRQGQSPYMILENHPEIAQSEKTLYNYIEAGAFSVKNIDLQKKVVYKPRRTHKKEVRDSGIFEGRTYKDFEDYLKEFPDTSVVEMDTVEGCEGSRKVLLTLCFRNCHLMPAFLLEAKEAKRVLSIFDRMETAIGTLLFNQCFQVILTDRGTEFSNPDALECGDQGIIRTSIYYCDPMASWQKGQCEKNHEYIRKILPKGSSFDGLTQADINLVMSHVNSTPRQSLGGLTPLALAKMMLPAELLDFFSLTEIAPDDVILTPDLLK